jgi:hypothetical protein
MARAIYNYTISKNERRREKMRITLANATKAVEAYRCTCTIEQILTAQGHAGRCEAPEWMRVEQVQPGTIVELWGLRIDVTKRPTAHADGRRLMLDGYAVQADQPVKILGHFNP